MILGRARAMPQPHAVHRFSWRRKARVRRGDAPPATSPTNAIPAWGSADRTLSSSWRDYLWALLFVFAATMVSEIWMRLLSHHRSLGMPFIVALLFIGAWIGLRPAIAAAILSFACYNFFLSEPLYKLGFEVADVLPLGTFLATALLVGGMAGRLSDRARSAAERLRRLTILFAASRDLSAAANKPEVAKRLAQHLKADAGLEAAIWSVEKGPRALLAQTERMVAEPVGIDDDQGAAAERTSAFYRIALKTARGEVGHASIWSQKLPLNEADRDWVEALLQLGAIALDRAALAAEISEARLVAEREGLRTALLSSLSHDLRTPIAIILASASSLAEQGEQFDAPTRRDLLETIQDQAERLNRYVANLLDMTRLETGVLVVKRTLVDPAEAMSSALEHTRRRLQGFHVVRNFSSPRGVAILVDPILLEQALVNIIENAAAFSAQGSRIMVGVKVDDDEVVLQIADEGPGISAEEIPRIFDKFFRGNPDRGRHAGVGLGLAVVRGVVEAFGGRVAVESPAAAGCGARFSIMFPAHDALEVAE